MSSDSGDSTVSKRDNGAPAEKKRSWRERLWSLPGVLATLVVSGAISAALAYYLPGLFHQASPQASPITFTVLDNTAPPLTMLIPQARTSLGQPGEGCGSFRSWGISQGGQDAGTTSFNLVVQGNTDSSVYIYGIRARVLAREHPAKGAVVYCPPSGIVQPRPIQIDLDTAGTGRYITSAPKSPFGFTVSKNDLEVFQITAMTSQCDCRWLLEVEAVVAGQTHQFVVTDHGRPFETTSYNAGSVVYEWNYSSGWYITVAGHDIGSIPAHHLLPAALQTSAPA